MDSVSQKNNLLSMTGIDQTEENTEDIAELVNKTDLMQTQISENANDITDLENITQQNTNNITTLFTEIDNFGKYVVPTLVKTTNVKQVIDGEKTFLNTLLVDGFKQIPTSFLGSTIYQPIKFCSGEKNSMSFSKDDGLWVNGKTEFFQNIFFNPQTKYSTGKCSMTFDTTTGFHVESPITLRDNALKISNISGLQDALNSATGVPDRSITTTKIALNTILGENIALNTISGANIGYFTILGPNIALNTISGENLKSDISIDTSGNITAKTFSVWKFDDWTKLTYKVPLMNVSIPCFPKLNPTNSAMYDFSFYNTDFVSDYAHPVDFLICNLTFLSPRQPLGTWIDKKMDLLFKRTSFSFLSGYTFFEQTEKIAITFDVYTHQMTIPIKFSAVWDRLTLTSTNNVGDIKNLKMIIHGYQS